MKIKSLITITAATLFLVSCGSKKVITEQATIPTTTQQTQVTTQQSQATSTQSQSAQQSVNITQASYVCDMDMSLGIGSDNYNLGGKVCMRQNEVVRLNLTFMGFIEVGIIEFTPDYVLVVNRMGKEYCKADYTLDVLKKNNITFDKVWTMANEQLQSSKKKDNSLGQLVQNLINTNMKNGKKVTVEIEFGEPNYKKSFDSKTELSSKYTQVAPDVLMSKLMSAIK